MSYYPNGNIDAKSDVGTYRYDTPRPHAISGIDNVGAGITNQKQFIEYTAFNKVSRIKQGVDEQTINRVYDIFYGLDEQRIKTVYDDFSISGHVKTRYYFGTYEKETDEFGEITETDYLYTPAGLTAMQRKTSSGAGLYYIHTDLLGSIERITNATGQIVSEYTYTPWGGRILLSGVNITDRGYTGHEHLSPFGDDSNGGFCLINMNGRIYDPVLARFLSPDPYVQAPDFTQSFNRYAYGWNNPFKFTDPSGNSIVAAILIGGGINLFTQILTGNVSSVQDAYLAFGIGGLSGWAGAGVGQAVSSAISFGGFAAGALSGAAGGAAGGFIGGASNAWFNGASLNEAIVQGLKGAGIGALAGGLIGGVAKGIDAVKNGKANFWDGHVELNLSNGYGAHNVREELLSTIDKVKATYVGKFEEIRVYESSQLGTYNQSLKLGSGGITLPEFGITVGRGVFSRGYDLGLMWHEFGHILQANDVGLFDFYSKIGTRSILSASFNDALAHSNGEMEQWANYMSSRYLYLKNAAMGIDYFTWNTTRFPIQNIDALRYYQLFGRELKPYIPTFYIK